MSGRHNHNEYPHSGNGPPPPMPGSPNPNPSRSGSYGYQPPGNIDYAQYSSRFSRPALGTPPSPSEFVAPLRRDPRSAAGFDPASLPPEYQAVLRGPDSIQNTEQNPNTPRVQKGLKAYGRDRSSLENVFLAQAKRAHTVANEQKYLEGGTLSPKELHQVQANLRQNATSQRYHAFRVKMRERGDNPESTLGPRQQKRASRE